MPFPLTVQPGDRAYFQSGTMSNSNTSGEVIIDKVGRKFITDTMSRRYRIADGGEDSHNCNGRLWQSRAEYEADLAVVTALVRLRRALERIPLPSAGPRPSLENVHKAAALLGLSVEAP